MSKILVNYSPTKENMEGFPVVKISRNEEVYVDNPMAAVELGQEYNRPVLYGDYKGVPTILEAAEVASILSELKKFYLKIKNKVTGTLEEVDEKDSQIIAWLPKDTKVEGLILKNGRIARIQPQKVVQEEDHGNS